MPAPIGTSASRFRLESHDHDGNFVAALPYQNLQGEWLLNAAGSQLRGQIPYRNYAQVTTANLYTGKHELWLYDSLVSTINPIFAGPVWDITAGSDTGTLSFSAQDALSYLAKRLLKAFRGFSAQRNDQMISNLITYVNSQRAMNLIAAVQTTSGQTSSQTYLASDRNQISDLLDSISQLDDKCDYFVRTDGQSKQHTLNIYGGQIIPTAKTYALDYGGNLDGYSTQYLGTGLANDFDIIGANGLIGNASAGAKQTEYDALYQEVDSSDQVTTVSLNNSAATALKDKKSTKVIPTLVTRKLVPIKDFDFGSQFLVSINDWYVQVVQTIRTTGWQLTVSQGDQTTTVIYTKDTEGVT